MTATAAIAAVNTNVDPAIWRAIAGYTAKVPSPGCFVYYFPEGHAEHLNNNVLPVPAPPFSQPLPSFFLCRVIGVEFLADPSSDQVFTRILLLPSPRVNYENDDQVVRNDGIVLDGGGGEGGEYESDDDDVVAFAKVLTPSDANNGGGFSIPRFCADSIFPLLDFSADPPVQNLVMNDVHGNSFHFRHIYRGTPRRHLLTTGWSKFVNAKKLVAGDSVVFLRRRSTEELFLGIRRASRNGGAPSARWNGSFAGHRKLGTDTGERVGFWSTNGRAVMDNLEMASRGLAFEVVYHPRPGWADFVVRAELVDETMNVPWNGGLRVKLAMESDDSSRVAWFHGTVSSVSVAENGPWCGSPWRMLQIAWDESEILRNCSRISPWQVEHVAQTTSLASPFPGLRKVKGFGNPEFLADAKENFSCDPMIGLFRPLAQKYTPPVGMQGARQDQLCFSSLFNCNSDITRQASTDDCVNTDVNSRLATVSMDLNSRSNFEDLSPNSQRNTEDSGAEVSGQQNLENLAEAGSKSFMLFGKVINLE